jgi:hypothetical protein
MFNLIDRAASDPQFLMQVRTDPVGAARAAGFEVSAEQLAELLGMPGSSVEQLTETLQERLSFVSVEKNLKNL